MNDKRNRAVDEEEANPTPQSTVKEPVRPVRVCILIDNLRRAGTELRILRLISGYDRRRVEPYLCLLDGGDPVSAQLTPSCPVLKLGIRSLKRPSSFHGYRKLFKFLRRKKIDVLEAYYRDSALVGIPVSYFAGVPRRVITSFSLGYWMTAFDRVMHRAYRPFIHGMISNCEAARSAGLKNYGIERVRSTVIRNGIDLDPYLNLDESNGTKTRPHVGMVANLRPAKDPQQFVRAANELTVRGHSLQFSIAGEGPLRQELQQQIDGYGLTSSFDLRGSVTDIPRYLRSLDVAVLSSTTEASSNSVIEYMASAKPIIVTNVGGNAELVENEVHGLVIPPQATAAMADAIERLVQDTDLAKQFGAAARKKALAEYGTAAMIREYEQFYIRLLQQNSSEGGCDHGLAKSEVASSRRPELCSKALSSSPNG